MPPYGDKKEIPAITDGTVRWYEITDGYYIIHYDSRSMATVMTRRFVGKRTHEEEMGLGPILPSAAKGRFRRND
jgi:hypothetical protein